MKTKQKISIVLDYFGGIERSDNFGIKTEKEVKIYIGDVLEKMHFFISSDSRLVGILQRWTPCGLSKSLNEIFSATVECNYCETQNDHCHSANCYDNELMNNFFKNLKIQDLLDFLYNSTKENE